MWPKARDKQSSTSAFRGLFSNSFSDNRELLKLLRDVQILSLSGNRNLCKLCNSCTLERYPKGSLVLRQDTPVTKLHIIANGECRLLRATPRLAEAAAQEKTSLFTPKRRPHQPNGDTVLGIPLASLRRADVFGAEALTGLSSICTVLAVSDVQVVTVPAESLLYNLTANTVATGHPSLAAARDTCMAAVHSGVALTSILCSFQRAPSVHVVRVVWVCLESAILARAPCALHDVVGAGCNGGAALDLAKQQRSAHLQRALEVLDGGCLVAGGQGPLPGDPLMGAVRGAGPTSW
ncbi:hypothetical protein CYMTET_23691 [Cymbomonas tetramitiformis]|uniref:Cyclic nucleotide-binding domain-containing protein n=1 Tax=Cymbomonas tetramitiformis TaxID=36881 RepID=A0AAE0FXL2_9CHLO|nr:hypothetical protein CYMTET_23691 [Cymbomonas tetramitiformis]